MSKEVIRKAKEMAARGVLKYIKDDIILGVGSGSTVEILLKFLTEKITNGELKGIKIISTSFQVTHLLARVNIPVLDPWSVEKIDITIDGADEIDRNFNIIKGGGGALLREKIVAHNSDKYIIIADYTKFTEKLCTRSSIPIEVIPFAARFILKRLSDIGTAKIRYGSGKVGAVVTDNGNIIIDFIPSNPLYIEKPLKLEQLLKNIPGVIETGLFVGYADIIVKGLENSYRIINIDIDNK
ncbi:MAG: ribose 5-phosphate isomerase A [Candidatus Asgardarchaeia archaeon]